MRAKLHELFKRLTDPLENDKRKIYCNGDDNAYPERVERVIDNSPTARMSSRKMMQFIIGQGFNTDFTVNSVKGNTLYDVLRMAAKSISYHRGVFLHVNYDITGTPNYLDVLPYSNCRISKEDDRGVKGAVYYSTDWSEEQSTAIWSTNKKKKDKWYYPYNPNVDVINSQRRKDAGENSDLEGLVTKYRGQVMFINLDPEKIYPLAYIDAAYNDADSEYRISVFKNTTIRNGFTGKIIATLGSSDEYYDEDADNLAELIGEENGSDLLTFQGQHDAEGNIMEAIKIDVIESKVDDELYKHTEESISRNVARCFNNIPRILIESGDGAMFGASGDSIREAKMFYHDETEDERRKLTDCLNIVLEKKLREDGLPDLEIIPLIDELEDTVEEEPQGEEMEGDVPELQAV